MPAKRLALLHNAWPVTPFCVHFAKGLVQAGLEVDFFYDERHSPMADIQNHTHIRGLQFFRITPDFASNSLESCLEYRDRVVSMFGPNNDAGYAGILGVEKTGCILAAAIGKKLRLPHFCWSLELYDEKHPWYRAFAAAPSWLKMEADALQSAEAILIQDEDRAAVLDARLN
ncbi:MAG: hypothetical protein LBV01_01380, partial [Deltaproteobacteria bacterium]|nr:hypothetical protein [Deltaproteobacteria bacterium]